MRPSIIFVFLLLCQSLFAAPKSLPVPGGIIVLPLEDNVTSVTFLNKRAALFKEKGRIYAVLPVPLTVTPGVYEVLLADKKLKIEIEAKEYAVQRLQIKNRRKVEPAREDLVRITKERSRKQKAKSFRSPGFADLDFIWPTTGRISSPFGLKRVLNGRPKAPHRGIDIAAPEGREVFAAADGIVVDAGDFFFSGNLVFIEHHGGVVTTYAHLQKIVVKPKSIVRKGELIGFVGKTGRVTGEHLHFGVMIDSIYVDPLLFLPTRQPSIYTSEKLSKISSGSAKRETIPPEG